MKLSKPLATLLLSLALSSCATYKVSDFQASITLPATLDCYSFNVLSGKEERIPADDPVCIDKKLKSIWLDSENWKMLRKDIQRNCAMNQCKQITGAFDELFLKIDSALQKIPAP